MQPLQLVMPTLVLALGVCAATAIANVTSTSSWLLSEPLKCFRRSSQPKPA